MEQDEESVPQVCGLLHAYFRRTGQADRVREVENRMDRHEAAINASKTERATVTSADTIIPHECGEADLESLRSVIAAEPQVIAAYLGRKQMRHFKKQPLFVLCVAVRRAWHRLPDRALEQAVARRLFAKVRLPGRVLVFAPSGSFSALARKLRAVPRSKIFESRRIL